MSLKRRYRHLEHLGAELLEAQIHTLENRSVESPTTTIRRLVAQIQSAPEIGELQPPPRKWQRHSQ